MEKSPSKSNSIESTPASVPELDPNTFTERLGKARQEVNAITDRLDMHIDSDIREPVAVFLASGLNTTMSCEGHAEKTRNPVPYIDIAAPNEPEWQYGAYRTDAGDVVSKVWPPKSGSRGRGCTGARRGISSARDFGAGRCIVRRCLRWDCFYQKLLSNFYCGMGTESPKMGNKQEAAKTPDQEQKEMWEKRDKMVERWNDANGPMLIEALEDAKTVEDIIAAVKVCGIKDERSGEKIVIKFFGGKAVKDSPSREILSKANVSSAESTIRAAVESLERGQIGPGGSREMGSHMLNDYPNEVFEKLKEIVQAKEKPEGTEVK